MPCNLQPTATHVTMRSALGTPSATTHRVGITKGTACGDAHAIARSAVGTADRSCEKARRGGGKEPRWYAFGESLHTGSLSPLPSSRLRAAPHCVRSANAAAFTAAALAAAAPEPPHNPGTAPPAVTEPWPSMHDCASSSGEAGTGTGTRGSEGSLFNSPESSTTCSANHMSWPEVASCVRFFWGRLRVCGAACAARGAVVETGPHEA